MDMKVKHTKLKLQMVIFWKCIVWLVRKIKPTNILQVVESLSFFWCMVCCAHRQTGYIWDQKKVWVDNSSFFCHFPKTFNFNKYRLFTVQWRLRCLDGKCSRQSVLKATQIVQHSRQRVLAIFLAWNWRFRSTNNDWLCTRNNQSRKTSIYWSFAGN
jgi:hypothetical protein